MCICVCDRFRYGDVFRTHILGKAIIVSTDSDVNKAILQNHGNAFVPCYPKSVSDLLGESSILKMNGPLHKRVHAIIGVFLKSPQFKARITSDIEKSVIQLLSSWKDKNCQVYVQEETRKVWLFHKHTWMLFFCVCVRERVTCRYVGICILYIFQN